MGGKMTTLSLIIATWIALSVPTALVLGETVRRAEAEESVTA